MKLDDQQLKELLIKQDYLTADDLKVAEKFAQAKKIPLLEAVLAEGVLTESLLGQAIAESVGLDYFNLAAHEPTEEQLFLIPEPVARQYRVIFIKEDARGVHVSTDEPWQSELISIVQTFFSPKQVSFHYSLSRDIDTLLLRYRKPLEERLEKIIQEKKRVVPEIVAQIFSDAIATHTSDIHLEPQEAEIRVRFRIDGILHEIGKIPLEYYEGILNKIKVLAHVRTDDHFSAQDGAIRYTGNHVPIDLRVSIIPTLNGEKVTIRLLAQYVRESTLDDLGFSLEHQAVITEAATKPFGMIIVAGPTGSGKTTTLYAVLKRLNQPQVNITTIEDPVEYRIPHLNQIQVNPLTHLTFARGLKSIVRQDPDIILVGEIRDKETAEIAVNAALTGHLLMSTFNATDAASTIPRLLDMGLEPFLIASTLELVVAQRLIRKICMHCRSSFNTTQTNLQKIFPKAAKYFKRSTTLYAGKGCSSCQHTGYQGRTALFEYIQNTPEMQELLLKNPSTREIAILARSQHPSSLFEDGIEKVKNGITTLEEVLRVAKPSELP